jgi:solute carrier family 25 phosphate transporter 23/24/25/41
MPAPTALEHEHAAHIEAIFNKYDADRSGSIDAAELPLALAELGVDASDATRVNAMLTDVDMDHSGQLDLAEFSQMFATGRLRNVFDEIDLDRSGTISTDELGRALKALGCSVAPSQVASMLAEVDADGSGAVSFDEFSTFFAMVPFASLDSIAQRWASLDGVMGASDLAPPIPPTDVPTWLFLAAGGTGGCISRTATAPLERVKLAAQIRGSGVKIVGELSAAYAQSGVKGLFAGNFANCIRVFPYAGIVALAYNRMIAMTPADGEFDSMEPVYRGGCAATAGVIGQIATYPLDIVRARLTVADGGSRQSVLGTLRCIHNAEGVRGLYRGLLPTCMATAPFLAIQLPTLDIIKMSASAANVPISNSKSW